MGSISARVPDDLEEELQTFIDEERLDTSTAIRKLLSEGLEEWRTEQALERLERGEVTFIDILPALKREDSPKGIFRLRVSSVLKYAFAWNVEGRRPVVTKDVRYSAYSPVNGAFLPTYSRRRRRLAIHPAR